MSEASMGETDFLTYKKVTAPRLERLEETQERLVHVVMGNGEPGLDEQVRTIAVKVDDMLQILRHITWGLLGAGLLGVATVLWQVVVWAIKQGGVTG